MKPGNYELLLIGLTGSLAFAGSKVASDMPHSTASGMVDVIVQYKSFAGVRSVAGAGPGAAFSRYFRSIPATHMTVPVSMIQKPCIEPAGGLHLARTGPLPVCWTSPLRP